MKTQKHHSLFLLMALSFMIFSACSDEDEVQPGQLLSNTDVETGSDRPNSWWYSTGQDRYDLSWTEEESLSDSRSLTISTQLADTAEFAFWAQTINNDLPYGRDVTLRVNIKGNLSGEGVSIVIRGDDTSQPSGRAEQFMTSQGSIPISGNFEWEEFSVRLAEIDASMKSLTVYLVYLENTSGEVFFDDVTLTH